ncbi:MAG: Ppx/GppA family phosphatase [Gemmatimonadetes bacterium]|nr:Ppx/GppA family phosphatase [Gemmatimonadota bacterium]
MTAPALQPERPRLAAIDIGTNTIRLVVAEVEPDGTYRILDEEREAARLGQGLAETGRLSATAVERALAALGKMRAIADGFAVQELRAVATAAVREASNGRAFCREVQRRHKVKIEIISGDEEAQLAFRSAARHFNFENRSTALVDIGGGSLEVILTAGTVIDQLHSFPLGAVRVSEQYVKSDPLRPKHWRKLKKAIDRTLKEGLGKPPFSTEAMIGSGGTFTALAHMAQWQREGRHGSVQGYTLTRADLVHLLDRLRETPLEARREIPGLSADRADIIVAGAAAIARLAKRLGTRQILVNERGIRDGILLQMIGRLSGQLAARAEPADRIEWVRVFARKCRSNEPHCDHVAKLAGQIFDGLQLAYDLPPAGRELLQAGALLHDIGYIINHAKHHKHAYHLIMHGDLPGFSPHEVEVVANVARYHRRAFPRKKHANLAHLEKDDRRLIARLAGILRVADGLDRAHSRLVTGIRAEDTGQRVRLVLEAPSLPQVEMWDAERKADLFLKTFDTELELVWRDPAGRTRAGRRAGRRAGGRVWHRVLAVATDGEAA